MAIGVADEFDSWELQVPLWLRFRVRIRFRVR